MTSSATISEAYPSGGPCSRTNASQMMRPASTKPASATTKPTNPMARIGLVVNDVTQSSTSCIRFSKLNADSPCSLACLV